MDTSKIAERFRLRKNRTAKAMSDLQEIFDWISETVDDVTFHIKKSIRLRGSNYNNSGDKYFFGSNDQYSPNYVIAVDCGICGIYPDEDGPPMIGLHEIDYINMGDLQEALELLFAELEKFSTREVSTHKIAAIAAMVQE